MRLLYTLIFYLALPAVLFRLYWRGAKAPPYRQRWRERLGFYQQATAGNVIWFHAVSVGEAEAAFALIRAVRAHHPLLPILVTTTTPTGSARVKAVLADQVEHVYLPYDLPDVIERFLDHFTPRLAVILEKEMWPNLFAACAKRQLPLFIVNARLSARSARAYQKIPALIQPALRCVKLIAAQTAEDRQRFIEIGADPEQVHVLGNIKFDVEVAADTLIDGQALKNRLFAGRFIWILASTHHDEEARLLPVYGALKRMMPELLLVIAPRHPERFDVVEKLCLEQGLRLVRRSRGQAPDQAVDVYLADSMGELKMLYAAADVAFVGGSLVPVGGHNVLEPALVGTPILFGSHMFNFQEIAERMLQRRSVLQCQDAAGIEAAILKLHDDPAFREELVLRAKAFVLENQGATNQLLVMLTPFLD